MRRLLALLGLIPLLAVGIYAATTAAGPQMPAHAATPDILCSPATWWHDEQTQQFINDGLPSIDFPRTNPDGSLDYVLPVPAEEPSFPAYNGVITVCYDYPPDGIWYLRNNQSGPGDNLMAVQLITNLEGKPQGPQLGYNTAYDCAQWFNSCPVVSGEYGFVKQAEWKEICIPGHPGKAWFQNYWTGLYMTTGENVMWRLSSAPQDLQSGQWYIGAGIGPANTATTYTIPGECGSKT